jgi:hypothetical protein
LEIRVKIHKMFCKNFDSLQEYYIEQCSFSDVCMIHTMFRNKALLPALPCHSDDVSILALYLEGLRFDPSIATSIKIRSNKDLS